MLINGRVEPSWKCRQGSIHGLRVRIFYCIIPGSGSMRNDMGQQRGHLEIFRRAKGLLMPVLPLLLALQAAVLAWAVTLLREGTPKEVRPLVLNQIVELPRETERVIALSGTDSPARFEALLNYRDTAKALHITVSTTGSPEVTSFTLPAGVVTHTIFPFDADADGNQERLYLTGPDGRRQISGTSAEANGIALQNGIGIGLLFEDYTARVFHTIPTATSDWQARARWIVPDDPTIDRFALALEVWDGAPVPNRLLLFRRRPNPEPVCVLTLPFPVEQGFWQRQANGEVSLYVAGTPEPGRNTAVSEEISQRGSFRVLRFDRDGNRVAGIRRPLSMISYLIPHASSDSTLRLIDVSVGETGMDSSLQLTLHRLTLHPLSTKRLRGRFIPLVNAADLCGWIWSGRSLSTYQPDNSEVVSIERPSGMKPGPFALTVPEGWEGAGPLPVRFGEHGEVESPAGSVLYRSEGTLEPVSAGNGISQRYLLERVEGVVRLGGLTTNPDATWWLKRYQRLGWYALAAVALAAMLHLVVLLERERSRAKRERAKHVRTLDARVAGRTSELEAEKQRLERRMRERDEKGKHEKGDEERLQRMLDSVEEAILVFDRENRVIRWNAAALTVFGVEESSFETIPLQQWAGSSTTALEALAESARQTGMTGEPVHMLCTPAAGDPVRVRITVTPLPDEDSRVGDVMLALKDLGKTSTGDESNGED
ncbi:PAS domain-containing protein, partial [bacterium]|nr:PAS domain-containing protein [bacterium]